MNFPEHSQLLEFSLIALSGTHLSEVLCSSLNFWFTLTNQDSLSRNQIWTSPFSVTWSLSYHIGHICELREKHHATVVWDMGSDLCSLFIHFGSAHIQSQIHYFQLKIDSWRVPLILWVGGSHRTNLWWAIHVHGQMLCLEKHLEAYWKSCLLFSVDAFYVFAPEHQQSMSWFSYCSLL